MHQDEAAAPRHVRMMASEAQLLSLQLMRTCALRKTHLRQQPATPRQLQCTINMRLVHHTL